MMNKFLLQILAFATLVLLLLAIFISIGYYITRANFQYTIPQEKNILVVGDSHTECAITDEILPNVFNLSKGASSYFYSYLKIRELTQLNLQIDTVVVGYSYHNLNNNWFYQEKNFFYLETNLPFMEVNDIYAIFKGNPIFVLKFLPKAVFTNLNNMFHTKKAYIGGFNSTNEVEMKEVNRNKKVVKKRKIRLSKAETNYLIKLYEFCQEKKLTLILLNIPIHPLEEEHLSLYRADYCSFAKENLPNAILINHSNFVLPDHKYSDRSHLNVKGAKTYSEFLLKNQFKYSLQECE